MRRLVVTEFMTLDGVMEDPHKWSFPYWNEEIGKFKHDETFASDAQLLGRVTYEGFAASWPGRTDKEGFADRFNAQPKYVVSKTLKKADWNNSRIIRDNVPDEVAKLKQQSGQDILVHGSAKLVQTLMQNDLIDEYHLLVYPIVLGSGKRLFGETGKTPLRLVETKTYSTGVVLFRCQPDRTSSG